MIDFLVIVAFGVFTLWAIVKTLALAVDSEPIRRPAAVPIRKEDP